MDWVFDLYDLVGSFDGGNSKNRKAYKNAAFLLNVYQ